MIDRYLNNKKDGIDCILLTKDGGHILEQTLDSFYQEVPIRRLLCIDGDSKDNTLEILYNYPRVELTIYPTMTTGKAWEVLKNQVTSPYFVWIDNGKIPKQGWYDEMCKHKDKGDILGSLRYNDKDGVLTEDPIIRNPSLRLLGGPWMVRTSSVKQYHVEDDFAQRNIDIIIRRQLEEHGGKYHLVTSTSHVCYLPVPVTDKKILKQRHDQNARGIIKYITPEYALSHASYLFDDHWMLMYSSLPRDWIIENNKAWMPIITHWKARRYLYARSIRLLYRAYNSILNQINKQP